MLTLDPIVKVNLNVAAATRVSNVYDIGVIMGTSDRIDTSTRFQSFANMTEVAAVFQDEDPEYDAAEAYFGVTPAPEKLVICRIASGETAGAALTDMANKTGDWYGVCLCDESEANVKAVNTVLKTLNRGVLFTTFTGTSSAAVGNTGIMNYMFNDKTSRVLLLVQNTATKASAAAMGVAMGLTSAHSNDAFALCYKTVEGAKPISATQSEVDAIKAINGNVYVTRGYNRNLLEPGTTSSGLRYDEVLYMDMIAADMQDRCVSLLAGNTSKLPQNDTTSAIFINALTGVLAGYANRGILDAGIWRGNSIGGIQTGDVLNRGYYLYCESYDEQSQADREAHKAMPIFVCISLSGSVESIELTVNVQR